METSAIETGRGSEEKTLNEIGGSMRQKLNEKNTKRIATKYNLPIHHILVRGGTNHRKDLCLEDGSIKCLCPDGTITESEIRWENA
jgi:hypothetical protein